MGCTLSRFDAAKLGASCLSSSERRDLTFSFLLTIFVFCFLYLIFRSTGQLPCADGHLQRSNNDGGHEYANDDHISDHHHHNHYPYPR